MRISIKTVKGQRYLQFIDDYGNIIHIGATSDFDSWIISAIIWDNEWTKQYYHIRNNFFDLLEDEMERDICFDTIKKNSFKIVRTQKIPANWLPARKLGVPRHALFGNLERNKNKYQRKYRPIKWCPNEWGAEIQKRLDEISSKQKRLLPKNNQVLTKKELRLRNIRYRKIVSQKEANNKKRIILSVIREIEEKQEGVSLQEIFSAQKLQEMLVEEITSGVRDLIDSHELSEVAEGCFTTH